VDAASAVLGYQGLQRSAPEIAADQPRTPALTPGSDFFMLFFQAMAPSLQTGNYYSELTLRKAPGDPEGRNYQQRLEREILNSPRKLEPADVVRLALRATDGNYPLAMLTAHNLFKEITYLGRDEVDINTRARQGLPAGRAPLSTIGIHPRYGRFASKLVSLRLSANRDKMGPWYHFFVPLAAEAWASRHSAYWMEAFEHGARHIGWLSNDDSEKQRIDECATKTAFSINNGMARRPQEEAAPPAEADPVVLPPRIASTMPKGRVVVELVDDLSHGESIPYGAAVTLTGESGDGRTVIEMSAGAEEEVPPGTYSVRARILNYAYPSSISDFRGLSNPADWYGVGETTGVVVKPNELTRVVVRMPNTRGNLMVNVRDERGRPISGIAVSLDGPMPAGPFESPAGFHVTPGNYRVMIPNSEVNGTNYSGKVVPAQVIANRNIEITIDLKTPPPLPQPGSISIDPGWLNLNVNDDYELAARVLDTQGQTILGAAVTWSSSRASVANVDAFGKVTGRGRGEARIFARSGNVTGSIPVTVTSHALLSSCVIAEHPRQLPAGGGSFIFKAVALDTDGKPVNGATFTWSGSNYVVALVNQQTGKVTTEKPGELTIFAKGIGRDGSEVLCSAEITVEARYQTVLVSGQVVRSDGSAAAGATVRASGGPPAPADAQGNFTVMAAGGPHVDGAILFAEATQSGASGRASGLVKSGAVKNLRITLGSGSSTPAGSSGSKRRINAHLFRLWPIDKPTQIQFLLYASATPDKSGHFKFPDGNGGVFWRAGEDLGLYQDEDSLCAVLRGYGQRSVDYNLYWYTVRCPREGPVAKPAVVISGPPQTPSTAPSDAQQTATQVVGSVTVGGRPLKPQEVIPPGSSLEVGKDSRVSIPFRDGSVVHVGESSKVKVSAPNRLEIQEGTVEVEHTRQEGMPSFDGLETVTPDARIVPTGTRYRVAVTSRGSGVQVSEGAVRVSGSMLARTDASFQVPGKPSYVKELHINAGDHAFAFRLPSWSGATGGAGTAAAAGSASTSPLARPDPWNDPQVQQLIDEWLRTATPEVSARYPGQWKYSDWGVVIGPGTTVVGPPDHPAGWSRHQTLWAYRTRFTSLNLCTLGEFVERRIAGKGLDGCSRSGAGSSVPSWMAPSTPPAQPAAGNANHSPPPNPGNPPPKDPLTQAREQLTRTEREPQPAPPSSPPPPAPPVKFAGVWSCSVETSLQSSGRPSSAKPIQTDIRIDDNNLLHLDKSLNVSPTYIRGNTIGYKIGFRLFDTAYTGTYDAELRGTVLLATGKVVGSDGTTAYNHVTCSRRHDPAR
jgi:hypothetical protein